jgi:hypothetical protein
LAWIQAICRTPSRAIVGQARRLFPVTGVNRTSALVVVLVAKQGMVAVAGSTAISEMTMKTKGVCGCGGGGRPAGWWQFLWWWQPWWDTL